MSKNYIQLEIGGKKRGLPFKAGTLRRIQELSESDPFQFLNEPNTSLKDSYKQVGLIIYAALLASCSSKKEDPDFTFQEVVEWVDDMDMSDIGLVSATFQAAYFGTASGEGGSDTQQPAAHVAGD